MVQLGSGAPVRPGSGRAPDSARVAARVVPPGARVPREFGAAVAGLGMLLSALIAGLMRWGPDWPAQEFRAWTAAHDGLTAWTNQWYSGQALPGYSLHLPDDLRTGSAPG